MGKKRHFEPNLYRIRYKTVSGDARPVAICRLGGQSWPEHRGRALLERRLRPGRDDLLSRIGDAFAPCRGISSRLVKNSVVADVRPVQRCTSEHAPRR